jgi:hypothetical protein
LIDIGGGHPAIVVEPEVGAYPNSAAAEALFIESLEEIAQQHTMTRMINQFYFKQSFPVDVRHNAKIHRLSLARQFAQQ